VGVISSSPLDGNVINKTTMRFDRRKIYPENNPSSKLEVLKTIMPERIGGVVKSRGTANVSLNRAVGRVAHPFIWKIEAQRMNHGGTGFSKVPFFGWDHLSGITFPDRVKLVTAHNFPEGGSDDVAPFNATVELVPEGLLVTATAAASFGIRMIFPVQVADRIVAVAEKITGTFVNWEGGFDGVTNSVKPGSADGVGQAITSIEPNDVEGVVNYEFRGITNVTIGDQMLIRWVGLARQY
jgi:hypothetical protein